MDYICVYSTADRDRIQAAVDELHRAGILTALFPSDRSDERWDIEVAAEDAERAREILTAVRQR